MPAKRRTPHPRRRWPLAHALAPLAAAVLVALVLAATATAPGTAGVARAADEAPGAGDARAADDAGIVLVLDLARLELRARDARTGASGPRLRVAAGSPAQPTPAGVFPLERVILNPAWTPGASARSAGALPEPPSLVSPMGVAKIPFAGDGEIALHGGASDAVLGMPVSAGCVRASDADLLRLVAWLHGRGALAAPVTGRDGEVHRPFGRPAELHVAGPLRSRSRTGSGRAAGRPGG